MPAYTDWPLPEPYAKPLVERVPLTPPATMGLCHDEPGLYLAHAPEGPIDLTGPTNKAILEAQSWRERVARAESRVAELEARLAALLSIRCTVTDAAALDAIPVAAAHRYLREHGWKQQENIGRVAYYSAEKCWITVAYTNDYLDHVTRLAEMLEFLAVEESRSQLAVLADLQALAMTMEVA